MPSHPHDRKDRSARVLVTGADGFVGEHLLRHLLDGGHDITASALTLPPDRNTMTSEEAAAVDWKVADVLDPAALYRVLAAVQPEWICHLAGFASSARARTEAETAIRVNAGGTVNLMDALLAARGDFPELDPLVLVLGSGSAYGDAAQTGTSIDESLPLRPMTPYGLSKACQELVAHTYRRAHGLRTVVARPFALIGPGQKQEFVVPNFCHQVASIAAGRTEPVVEVGDLEVERDLLDVRDGARALGALLECSQPDAAYNVCSGRAVRIGQLLDWILDEAGVEAEVRVDPQRLRDEEPTRLVGDPTRLRDQTGWAPEKDVETTVRETYRWFARQRA